MGYCLVCHADVADVGLPCPDCGATAIPFAQIAVADLNLTDLFVIRLLGEGGTLMRIRYTKPERYVQTFVAYDKGAFMVPLGRFDLLRPGMVLTVTAHAGKTVTAYGLSRYGSQLFAALDTRKGSDE